MLCRESYPIRAVGIWEAWRALASAGAAPCAIPLVLPCRLAPAWVFFHLVTAWLCPISAGEAFAITFPGRMNPSSEVAALCVLMLSLVDRAARKETGQQRCERG